LRAESKEPEFLLEVGTEEIPAWMIEGALADLKRRLEEGLREARLAGDAGIALEMYATPRRLIAYCPRLPARQPSSVETVQGPPKRVAFDAQGKPTAAANAFAAKMGTTIESLETVSTPKGEYLVAQKKDPGRATADILAELIPRAVLAIPFPRTMHWEGKAGPRFIRPIRSLLALLGGKVVPCAIGSVQAGAATFGHRLLGKRSLTVRDFASYRKALEANGVLIDPKQRRARILEAAEALLKSAEGSKNQGLRIKPNEELLNTLVYLTEFPTPLLGEFDEAFLALPEEVLITVMKGHQKYLSLERVDGTLAPRFIAVMDKDADPAGLIRHGHERVLRARFTDARFFWEADAEIPLRERRGMLSNVTFQAQLGSYHDKADRMTALAYSLAAQLREEELALEPRPPDVGEYNVIQAAGLAKCDLTTDLVKEFTELQGIVGGLYARREGLPEPIAAAIYDHYRPQGMEDALPRTREGDLVSLSDRMDTLAGCFGVGLAPSGSRDPFGLRRAAQGVIRILAEHHLRFALDNLVAASCRVCEEAKKKGGLQAWDEQAALAPLVDFLVDRLRYYLREVRGYAYDEVNAILAAGGSESRARVYRVPDVLERLAAVSTIRSTDNFEPLAAAFKRMKNILRQARESHGFTGGSPNPELLEPGPEADLFQAYRKAFQEAERLKSNGNYRAALEEIASLRPSVDLFFDKILVMDKNPSIRNNRLSLLDTLLNAFSTIADFSEIVTAEEKKAGVQ
jgi:glycyl-tRNA synthetase beta chain